MSGVKLSFHCQYIDEDTRKEQFNKVVKEEEDRRDDGVHNNNMNQKWLYIH